MAQDHHLRGARPRVHQAAPRGPARAARHLRRPGHPAAIGHLSSLGVTAVELLPVHEFADDGFLEDRSLRNYWGYSTLGYFAPEQRYMPTRAPGGQVAEFKAMVKALHAAGIEVHPRRGLQPHLRGQPPGPDAEPARHRQRRLLLADAGARATTSTSPAPATASTPRSREAARLIVDSLRYWVSEMHVDGFRFDLATHAGPGRARRVHPARADLPDHRAGSGALAGQADRRAVGRRPRRLPGGQLSGAVRASGTASSATPCAATGRATRTSPPRSATG